MLTVNFFLFLILTGIVSRISLFTNLVEEIFKFMPTEFVNYFQKLRFIKSYFFK